MFIIVSYSATCQTLSSVRIKGKIENKDTNVEGIHILNISSLTATITNSEGLFEITVKENDTLLISSIQYESQKIIITKEIIKKRFITTTLIIKINELDEVVVKPHNLSGNLQVDIENTNTIYDNIRPSKLGLPNAYVKHKTQTERKLQSSGSGGNPIALLVGTITGYRKKLKRNLALEKRAILIDFVKNQFDISVYTLFFKIPEGEIDNFVYFCAEDIAFEKNIKSDDKLLLLDFLKEKSEQYFTINIEEN